MIENTNPIAFFMLVLVIVVFFMHPYRDYRNTLTFPTLTSELKSPEDQPFIVSDRRRYFGTHHKTGTILAGLVQEVANRHLSGTQLVSGFFTRPENSSIPVLIVGDLNRNEVLTEAAMRDAMLCPCSSFVHFVRDPIEMVVSAYMYHRSGPAEPWLYETIDMGFSAQWLGNVSLARIQAYIKSKPDYTPATPLNYLSWYDILQLVSPEVGIRGELEMQRVGIMPNLLAAVDMLNKAKRSDMKDLYKYCLPVNITLAGTTACEHAVDMHRHPSVMQVGLERFDHYNRTMLQIFEFLEMIPPAPRHRSQLRAHSVERAAERTMMLDDLAQFDATRMSPESKTGNNHITSGKNEDERTHLRAVAWQLARNPNNSWILDARRVLGYNTHP